MRRTAVQFLTKSCRNSLKRRLIPNKMEVAWPSFLAEDLIVPFTNWLPPMREIMNPAGTRFLFNLIILLVNQ